MAMIGKKVRFAIYEGPFKWGWVHFGEMSGILGLTPAQLVVQYGRLSKDADRNVLAAVVGGEFGNYDLRDLAEMDLTDAFVPAGWANDVLDEATGLNEKRRQARIEESAQKIFAELRQKGYSSYEYHSYFQTQEAIQILDKVQELAKAAGIIVLTIKAETNYTPADPYPDYTLVEVLYDTLRFECRSANYGPSFMEEESRLIEVGCIKVVADRVSEWGSVYYLRPLEPKG